MQGGISLYEEASRPVRAAVRGRRDRGRGTGGARNETQEPRTDV